MGRFGFPLSLPDVFVCHERGMFMYFGAIAILGICFLSARNSTDLPPEVVKTDDGQSNGVDRGESIVQLFEWRWDDIARECQDFLGPFGFYAVQTSPANENALVTNHPGTWYERYQPISYKLETRSGKEEDFRRMVKVCHEHGIKIYVDLIINHMSMGDARGKGSGGTPYDGWAIEYPGVPFGHADFNNESTCPAFDGNIHDYNNPTEVRNCRLNNLLDLNLKRPPVRDKIVGYLNRLIDIGVAGFRVDAAKHMWPDDLKEIFDKLKDVRQGGRPFIYQEVIDLGMEVIRATEYLANGKVVNFKYGLELANVFRRQNPLKYLVNWGEGWGMWPSRHVVNFIDNHDTQRTGEVLTHRESRAYKAATAFMLAHPYGMPRIMSSYGFTEPWEGPPLNQDMRTKHVNMTGLICHDGWVCEHRWRQIYNMVAFRNVAGDAIISNWWSGSDYQIAFSRGNKAFVVFNLEEFDLHTILQTGLPSGVYCDVISGNLENSVCTGSSVFVRPDGSAHIHLPPQEDPILALHIGARAGNSGFRFSFLPPMT